MTNPLITLMTDFGLSDHFVAALKGVIVTLCPTARLIDVTHQIPAHDIRAAAFVLDQTIRWFPPDTVHLAIVDPGVGSNRRILAGRWNRQMIVAPDNGLVSLVHIRSQHHEVYEVTNRELFLPEVSATFHGRDILAPVAAHLANGRPLSSVGPVLNQPLVMHLNQPILENRRLIGEVIYVDSFGNLITNISIAQVRKFKTPAIQIGKHAIHGLAVNYTGQITGQPLALIGSTGLLEIAVNQGSARDELKINLGEPVIVTDTDSC